MAIVPIFVARRYGLVGGASGAAIALACMAATLVVSIWLHRRFERPIRYEFTYATGFEAGRRWRVRRAWDGFIRPTKGLASPAELPNLTEALLRAGVKPHTIHKILGENVLRLLRAVPPKFSA